MAAHLNRNHFWEFICDYFRCDVQFTTDEAVKAYAAAGHLRNMSNRRGRVRAMLLALEKTTKDLRSVRVPLGKKTLVHWVLPSEVED